MPSFNDRTLLDALVPLSRAPNQETAVAPIAIDLS
jgi:hypothetical protein